MNIKIKNIKGEWNIAVNGLSKTIFYDKNCLLTSQIKDLVNLEKQKPESACDWIWKTKKEGYKKKIEEMKSSVSWTSFKALWKEKRPKCASHN